MNKFPYLWVLTENKIGRPVFAVAIIGQENLRCVPLPSRIVTLHLDKEIRLVGAIARNHYRRSGGSIRYFGPISGYIFARNPQQNWKLTTAGEVISFKAKSISRVRYTLTLKGKPNRDIAFLFRRDLRSYP